MSSPPSKREQSYSEPQVGRRVLVKMRGNPEGVIVAMKDGQLEVEITDRFWKKASVFVGVDDVIVVSN